MMNGHLILEFFWRFHHTHMSY